MHYDVVVVGAGPSGSVAAWELARNGLKVALLEKHKLPRHKTCGGGIPMVAADILEFNELKDLVPEAFIECDTRYMRHTFNFETPFLMPMNVSENTNLSLWMVRRDIFDNALANRAVAHGAELLDEHSVKQIICLPDGRVQVEAVTNSGNWVATCDKLVGADGVNGVVARQIGLRKERSLAIAMEAEVPHDWKSGHPDLRPEVLHLEFGAVPKGYAWVFPKSDHLNVGAGFFSSKKNEKEERAGTKEFLQNVICNYLTSLNVPYNPEELIYHSYPLPLWHGQSTLQNSEGNVFLSGDAAGLVNPFFGDGILHALRSGKIVANCILEKNTQNYSKIITETFADNFNAALRLSKIFYQWPAFCYKNGVNRPSATQTATLLLCGQTVFPDVTDRVINRIREAMRLGRRKSSVN